MAFSQKAFDMILRFEGMGQPRQWPGGESGVTIGFGYDLGYVTADQFQSDWGDHLSADVMNKLLPAIGLKGIPAKNKAAMAASPGMLGVGGVSNNRAGAEDGLACA